MKGRFTILSLLLCFNVIGQSTFNKDIQVADSLATQYGNLVIIDSFVYVVGITVSTEIPGQNRGLITKFDLEGNRIWERTYGDSLNTSEPENLRRTLSSTSDGHLVFTGFNRNGFSPFSSFLYKINVETGEQIFYQQYFNLEPTIGLSGNWVIETTDNGFLIGIDIREALGSTLIIKTDSNGDEEWRQTIPNLDDGIVDFTMMAVNLSSGNIFITTRLSEINCENNPNWNVQAKFIIIDLQGNILQEYETNPIDNISILSAYPSQDGGVFVAGSRVYQFQNQQGSVPFSCASNPYLAKYDSNLTLLWETEMGTDLPWYSQWWACKELQNGEVLVAGERYFGDQNEPIEGVIPVSGNLSKFSPTGDSLWSREIRPEWDNTFYNITMRFTGIDASEEGSIFLSGQLTDAIFASPTFGQHGWLVKTDALGCVELGCQIISSIENPDKLTDHLIFPNPSDSYLHIQFNTSIAENISIYNSNGIEVLNLDIHSSEQRVTIPISQFPNGIYLVSLVSKNTVVTQKVLIQH